MWRFFVPAMFLGLSVGPTLRADEPLTLVLDWPACASASVEARSEGHASSIRGKAKWELSTGYRLALRQTAGGFAVSIEDFDGWQGEALPFFVTGADRLAERVGEAHFGPNGKLLRVSGDKDPDTELAVRAVIEKNGGYGVNVGAVEAMARPYALRRYAQEHWSLLMGLAPGLPTRTDGRKRLIYETIVRQESGESLVMEAVGTNAGSVECPEGSDRTDCVRVIILSTPKADDLVRTLEKTSKRGLTPVEEFRQEVEVDLVVDRASLLPLQATFRRSHLLRTGGVAQNAGREEAFTKYYRFRWEKRPDEECPKPVKANLPVRIR